MNRNNTEPTSGAARVSTPWGLSTTRTVFADGIIFYTTDSHGGFWLSEQRIAELPPELRSLGTWCGQPWYEEDCDAHLVMLAFPQFFTDAEVFRAYEMMQRPPAYLAGVDLWLGAPSTAAVRTIAHSFMQKHKGHYRLAGAFFEGETWHVRAMTFDRTEAVIFKANKFPELGDAFTLDDVKKAGCEIVNVVKRTDHEVAQTAATCTPP